MVRRFSISLMQERETPIISPNCLCVIPAFRRSALNRLAILAFAFVLRSIAHHPGWGRKGLGTSGEIRVCSRGVTVVPSLDSGRCGRHRVSPLVANILARCQVKRKAHTVSAVSFAPEVSFMAAANISGEHGVWLACWHQEL